MCTAICVETPLRDSMNAFRSWWNWPTAYIWVEWLGQFRQYAEIPHTQISVWRSSPYCPFTHPTTSWTGKGQFGPESIRTIRWPWDKTYMIEGYLLLDAVPFIGKAILQLKLPNASSAILHSLCPVPTPPYLKALNSHWCYWIASCPSFRC